MPAKASRRRRSSRPRTRCSSCCSARRRARRWPRPQASVPSAPSAGATSMSASSRVCGGAARASASLTSTTRSTISWSRSAARCCRNSAFRSTSLHRSRAPTSTRSRSRRKASRLPPTPRWGASAFAASYTHLNATITKSLSSGALTPSFNPAFPGIPIGNFSPLLGQQPFRRPANTGNLFVSYARGPAVLAVSGYFAGKSDDSTFLGGSDANFGNSLLLPNTDLDAGYAKMDVSGSYALNRTHQVVPHARKLPRPALRAGIRVPRAADQRADRRDRDSGRTLRRTIKRGDRRDR